MKCKVIIIWLLCYSLTYADCNNLNTKVYNSDVSSSVITFILINYTFLLSDLKSHKGEYLESLLNQLNFNNNLQTIDYLIDLLNSNNNPYDFAMAVTKDLN